MFFAQLKSSPGDQEEGDHKHHTTPTNKKIKQTFKRSLNLKLMKREVHYFESSTVMIIS